MLFYCLPFIFATILCLAEEYQLFKLDNFFYFCGFLTIGLIGGLRFQTGMDWSVYQNYFNSINISVSPIASYNHNAFQPSFEIGYFYLNYFIKNIGGTCSDVFLVASVFCSTAVYWFTSKTPGKKWYILTTYICFNFLYLHFATVRQSIGVAFFVIGAGYYAITSRKITSIMLASISILFQISSVIYIFLMLLAFAGKNGVRLLTLTISTLLFVFILSGFNSNFFYKIISFLLPSHSFSSKLLSYNHTGKESIMSISTYFFGASMVFFAIYITKHRKFVNFKFLNSGFIINYAIISLLATATTMIMFYSNFVMWTRLFNVASIFQAYAISLILSKIKKNKLDRALIFLGICFNFLLYYYFLTHGFKTLIPYKSILTN